MASPRVFISYSHDSEPHRDAVLALAQQLRIWGLDVQLDRFIVAPSEGWARWMMSQIDNADFVIVVCTANYRRRFEGRETPGQGCRVTLEGLLAIQHLYDASARNERFIPVVLAGVDADAVPLVLRPYTRYTLPAQIEALYRHITRQPEIVAVPLGPLRQLPPRVASPTGQIPTTLSPAAAAPQPIQAPAAVRSDGGRAVPVSPLELLHHLLLSLFGAGDVFRRWVSFWPNSDALVAELPHESVPPATAIADGLAVLRRHGHLNRDFFTRLADKFPRRSGDIDRVAMAWAAPPVAAMHGGIHIGHVRGNMNIQAGRDLVAGDRHTTTLSPNVTVSPDVRGALAALRTALAALDGLDRGKLDRALDDVADELARPNPDRRKVREALERTRRTAALAHPDVLALPEVFGPWTTLQAWIT